MFGKTVLGIEGHDFEQAIDAAKQAKGSTNDLDLDADDMRALVDTFKQIVKSQTDKDFPQDPRVQIDITVKAEFQSWNSNLAILYHRQHRIPIYFVISFKLITMGF